MENIIVSSDFHIEIKRENVLNLMDCYEDSPVYEETIEEYEELYPLMMDAIEAKGVIAFGEVPEEYAVSNKLPAGSKALYSIVTIGAKASAMSSKFFAEGDYLKGMLADSMADACVFAMEPDLLKMIKEECEKRNVGIRHRYEAPVDVPMHYQQIAWEVSNAKENLDMDITSGYMLDPLKSNCQVFGITDDIQMFQLEHDCRNCDNLSCKQRNVPDSLIVVYGKSGREKMRISCKEQESILEALIREGGYIPAPCGGRGTCGTCKIRIKDGELEITSSDQSHFSAEELEEGYRLSCKAYPKNDCAIELLQDDEDEFEVLGAGAEVDSEKVEIDIAHDFSFAIDIGTTTIAISLVDMNNSQIIDTFTTINHQRAYGADVISRIQAANEGKGEELKEAILKDLLEGIESLIKEYGLKEENIKAVVIAGNTTMGHLLMNFSCEGLGVVPFTPVDIGFIEKSFAEVFEVNKLNSTKVVLLPGITTYVGADIVSGMYACDMAKSDKHSLLVDLGTNGEMAIGNKEGFLVASTAMGPACEGGNITCGMGGVPGAISSISIQDGKATFQTIGNKEPIGLCGTGVLETVAELVKNELIDETGLLDEDYFDDGFVIAKTPDGEDIVFTQKDVREIQLAKSAVRAGVETLIQRAGITYDDVEHVYLAGGFGFRVDKEKAVAIGLFPEELVEKIDTVGNTSLTGAIQYVTNGFVQEPMVNIVEMAEEINLSVDKVFNDFYVEHMFFE